MNAPNFITLVRIFLTPFFFTSLIYYERGQEHFRWIALAIMIVASLTDAIDGFVARVWKSRTELGRFLDPLADKLLLLSGYIGLLFVDALIYRPPLWITILIVFRDLVIVSGMVVIYFISGRLRVHPNYLGKCTTAAQMVTLVAILLQWQIAVVFYYVTAILTILSLVVYSVRELKLLK